MLSHRSILACCPWDETLKYSILFYSIIIVIFYIVILQASSSESSKSLYIKSLQAALDSRELEGAG